MAHGLGELSLGELAKLKAVLQPLPTIGLDDFVDAVADVTGKATDRRLLELVYNLIDSDGSGDVTWDELMQHIESLRDDDLYGDVAGREKYNDHTIPQPLPRAKQCFHQAVIRHAALGARSDEVVTAADDGCIKIWNVNGLSYVDTLEHGSCAVRSMDYDAETDTIVSLSADQVVSVYNFQTRRMIDTFKLGKRSLATRGLRDEVYRGQLRIGEDSPALPFPGLKPQTSVLARLWLAQHNCFLQRVWARTAGVDAYGCTAVPDMGAEATAVSGCRAGSGVVLQSVDHASTTDYSIFIGSKDGAVQTYRSDIAPPVVHSLQQQQQQQPSTPRGGSPTKSGAHGGVTVHDMPGQAAEQRCIARVHHHTDAVTTLRCDRDGETIFSGSADSDIHVCHVERGTVIRTMKGTPTDTLRSHARGVRGIELCRSPKLLASWGNERFAVIWDPTVAKPLQALHGHVSRIVGLRFSPASEHIIVTYSEDKAVRIWDTRTFRCIQQVRERPWETHGPPGGVLYLPHNKNVVTLTHRMYRKEPRQQRFDDAYGGHTQGVLAAYYGRANSLICSCDESSVRVWNRDDAKLEVAWRMQRIEGICLDAAGDAILVDESGEDVRVISTTNGQPVLYLAGSRSEGATDLRTLHDAERSLWIVLAHSSISLYTAVFDPRAIRYPSALTVFRLPPAYAGMTAATLMGTRLIVGLRDGHMALVSIRDVKAGGVVDAPLFDDLDDSAAAGTAAGGEELRSVTNGAIHADVVSIVHHVSKLVLRRKTYLAKLNGIVAEELEEEDPDKESKQAGAANDDVGAAGAAVDEGDDDFRAEQELAQSRRRVEALALIGGESGLTIAGTGGGSLVLSHAPLGITLLRWRVTLRMSASVGAVDSCDEDGLVYGDEMGYAGFFDISGAAKFLAGRKAAVGAVHTSDLRACNWRKSVHRKSFFRASATGITVIRWISERALVAVGSVDGCLALLDRSGARITVLGVRPGDAVPFPEPSHAAEYRSTLAMFRKNALLKVIGTRALSVEEACGEACAQYAELFGDTATVCRSLSEMCPVQPERQFEALIHFDPDAARYTCLHPKATARDRAAYQVRRPLHKDDVTSDTVTEWDRLLTAASVPRQPALLEGRAVGQEELVHGLVDAAAACDREKAHRAVGAILQDAVDDEDNAAAAAAGNVAAWADQRDDGDLVASLPALRPGSANGGTGSSAPASREALELFLAREATARKRLVAQCHATLGRILHAKRSQLCGLVSLLRSRAPLGTFQPTAAALNSLRKTLPGQVPLPTLCCDEIPDLVDAKGASSTREDCGGGSSVGQDEELAMATHKDTSPLRWFVQFRQAWASPTWSSDLVRMRNFRLLSIVKAFEAHASAVVTALAPCLYTPSTAVNRVRTGLRRIGQARWYCDGMLIVHCTAPETVAEHVCLDAAELGGAKHSIYPRSGRKLAQAQLAASQALASVADEVPFCPVPPLVAVVSILGCTFACTAVLDVPSTAFKDCAEPTHPVAALSTATARQVLSLSSAHDVASVPIQSTVATTGSVSGAVAPIRSVLVRGWDGLFPPHAAPFQTTAGSLLLRQRTEAVRREGSSTLVASRSFDRSVPLQARIEADREANKLSRRAPVAGVVALVQYLARPDVGCLALGGGDITKIMHSFGVNVRFIATVIVSLRRTVQTLRQHGVGRRTAHAAAIVRAAEESAAAAGSQAGGPGASTRRRSVVSRSGVAPSSSRRASIAGARTMADSLMSELPAASLLATSGPDVTKEPWFGPSMCVEFLAEEAASRVVRDVVCEAMRLAVTGISPPQSRARAAADAAADDDGGALASELLDPFATAAAPMFAVDGVSACGCIRGDREATLSRAMRVATEALQPLLDAVAGDDTPTEMETFWTDVILPGIHAKFPDLASQQSPRIGLDVGEVSLRRLLGRTLQLSGLALDDAAGTLAPVLVPVARVKTLDPMARRFPLQPSEQRRIWDTAREMLADLSDLDALTWGAVAVQTCPLPLIRSDWAGRLAPSAKLLLARLPSAPIAKASSPTTESTAAFGVSLGASLMGNSPSSGLSMNLGDSNQVGRRRDIAALPAPAALGRRHRFDVPILFASALEHLRLAGLLFMGGEPSAALDVVAQCRQVFGSIRAQCGFAADDADRECAAVAAEMLLGQALLDDCREWALGLLEVCGSPTGADSSAAAFIIFASHAAATVEAFSDSPTHLANARARLQRAWAVSCQALGPGHVIARHCALRVAQLLRRMEQEAAAREVCVAVCRLVASECGPQSPELRIPLEALAQCHTQLERFDSALQDAATMRRCRVPDGDAGESAASAALVEAQAHIASNRTDRAKTVLAEATATVSSTELVGDNTLGCLKLIAQLCMSSPALSAGIAASRVTNPTPGASAAKATKSAEPQLHSDDALDFEGAFTSLTAAVAAVERRFGPRSVEAAEALAAVGDVHARSGRLLEALQLFRMAERIAAAVHGPNHMAVGIHTVRAARCAGAAGRSVEAAGTFREALQSFTSAVRGQVLQKRLAAQQDGSGGMSQAYAVDDEDEDAAGGGVAAAGDATASAVANDPPTAAFERHHAARMVAQVGVLFLTDAVAREAGEVANAQKVAAATSRDGQSGLEASKAARDEVGHLRAFGGSLQSQYEQARECFDLASRLALQEVSDLRHPLLALLRAYIESCDARIHEFHLDGQQAAKQLDQRRVLTDWGSVEPQDRSDGRDPLWYRKRLKVFKLRE